MGAFVRHGLAGVVALVAAGAIAACGTEAATGPSEFVEGPTPAAADAGTQDATVAPGFEQDAGSGARPGNTPSQPCTKLTCAQLGVVCGPAGDGCGGVLQCGGCVAPETCGGGGQPSKCGGAAGCVPKTCADLGATCGDQGDGCGGAIVGGCGTCAGGQFCGGGGPNTCGAGVGSADAGTCVPRTCAQIGATCGLAGDGCGGLVQCGATCPSGQICGGGGVANVCGNAFDGGPACTPKACSDFAVGTCGPQADGCGGLTPDCGACAAPAICGGGGPSRCGLGDAGAGACTGLCAQQVHCDGGATTTLSGKVWAPSWGKGVPGNHLPVYGALVYVPNAPLSPLPEGHATAQCETCSATASGAPLVQATTGADGSFTLTNVPAGSDIPLVVQLGRWRRAFTLPQVAACAPNTVADGTLRLPRNRREGGIPLTAVSTGDLDGLECVLRKIGVDDCEFTSGAATASNGLCSDGAGFTGPGRIRLYRDNGARPPGGGAPPNAASLVASQSTIDAFDQVVFGCVGSAQTKTNAERARVVSYADKGGRVFLTHYAYVWAQPSDLPWTNVGRWEPEDGAFNGTASYRIDTGTTKRTDFASWLAGVGITSAGAVPPTLGIVESRNDLSGPLAAGAERWIYGPSGTIAGDTDEVVAQATWNTPWGAAPANQCGRAIYSDFHVTVGLTGSTTFPSECGSGPLTDQEKVLAFMLFDLASCIAPTEPPPPPTCTARTCADIGAGCGSQGDGCGGVLDCGPCTVQGESCGGAGVPNQCGGPRCTPATCAGQGFGCGLAGDGCGGVLDCGPCTVPGQTCGGSGAPNQCGTASCAPRTCLQQGAECGKLGDTCGALIDCGPCPPGAACAGNRCVADPCRPRTCAEQQIECGPAGNGCGMAIDCGPCPPGQTCGGGGVPFRCGGGGIPR